MTPFELGCQLALQQLQDYRKEKLLFTVFEFVAMLAAWYAMMLTQYYHHYLLGALVGVVPLILGPWTMGSIHEKVMKPQRAAIRYLRKELRRMLKGEQDQVTTAYIKLMEDYDDLTAYETGVANSSFRVWMDAIAKAVAAIALVAAYVPPVVDWLPKLFK